jgi:hypothetical protein
MQETDYERVLRVAGVDEAGKKLLHSKGIRSTKFFAGVTMEKLVGYGLPLETAAALYKNTLPPLPQNQHEYYDAILNNAGVDETEKNTLAANGVTTLGALVLVTTKTLENYGLPDVTAQCVMDGIVAYRKGTLKLPEKKSGAVTVTFLSNGGHFVEGDIDSLNTFTTTSDGAVQCGGVVAFQNTGTWTVGDGTDVGVRRGGLHNTSHTNTQLRGNFAPGGAYAENGPVFGNVYGGNNTFGK